MVADRDLRIAICAAGELWGGVEEFVVTMVERLGRRGLTPLVILFHDAQLAARLRAMGVRPSVVEHGSGWDTRAVSEVRALLQAHRIEIVHTHGYKANIVAALASMAQGQSPFRLVKTEHGALETPSQWRAAADFARLALNVGLDRAISSWRVDAIVYVSHALRAVRPRGQGLVIHNGVDAAAIRERAGIVHTDPDAFTIGIVGRLTAVKGHVYLFRALSQLPATVRVRVLGAGPDEAALRECCEQLGVANRVEFAGFVSPVYPALAALDVLAMPSLHEGLPYTPLEAMALGVPVVASSVGGLREIIEDKVSGLLVPPRDPQALAAAIRALHEDHGWRQSIGAGGRQRVDEAFNADRMVGAYLDTYRALVA